MGISDVNFYSAHKLHYNKLVNWEAVKPESKIILGSMCYFEISEINNIFS